MKPLNVLLVRTLLGMKIQIFSISLLVALGIAILVASWSAYKSLSVAKENYYDQYQFAHIFAEVVRAPNSVLDEIQKIDHVEFAEGRIVDDGLIDLVTQAEPALGRIISISPEMKINKIHLRSGSWPESGAGDEVLIHESFANANNLKTGDTFFMNIKGQKRKLYISGVAISPEYIYALNPLSPFPDDRHFGIVWMLKSHLRELTGMQNAFNSVVITTQQEHQIPFIKQKIDRILEPYGTVGSYDRSLQTSEIYIADEIQQQKSMSYVVPSIFILVGNFILYTILSRLIRLNRPQIATLKSLGYSSLAVAYQYWKLVTVILCLGLLPGLIFAYGIGLWYTALYRNFFRFPDIQFNISTQAFLIGVIASFVPSWIVAIRVLQSLFKLQPAEAMRPTTAMSFRLTRFSRWLTSFRTLKISRLILRNTFFHPWRTFLSVLGLAAATAILINGSFWSDIMDYIMERQFHQASREDLEVRFLHPRKPDIITDLFKIPGIQMVESARVVSVSLLFRNIRKETALYATSEGSVLRRTLSFKGKEIMRKESALTLSRYFEDHYGIHVGDKVRLELTDKTHPPFWATVGAFVDDIAGATVYVRAKDLHNWIPEEPLIDVVYLKVDPTMVQNIYLKLKSSPEVLAVQVKKILLDSFNKNLSKMILTFTVILVCFATAIAGAVFYNITRISLSERSWELASMKILGFHTSELFHILYSEIGILLLMALTPGFLLGYYLSYLSTQMIHSETLKFPLVIAPSTYALSAFVLIASFLATGMIIYQNIKNLSTTEALKSRE